MFALQDQIPQHSAPFATKSGLPRYGYSVRTPVNKTKEDRPEWSKLIGKKELQRLLAPISRNTLNSRLIEGDIFAKGKIRYQAAKGARKIQVAVNDLPTDLQGRFRKSQTVTQITLSHFICQYVSKRSHSLLRRFRLPL